MLTKELEKRVNASIKETERLLEKARQKYINAQKYLDMEIADNLKLGNSDDANNLARERVKECEDRIQELEDHLDELNKKIPAYYFYNGFSKPKRIDPYNTELESNYLGDRTVQFMEEHIEYINESDREYNNQMALFNVYRNPTLEELQDANRGMCLDENTYLEEFIKKN